jgi:hypothetical protein
MESILKFFGPTVRKLRIEYRLPHIAICREPLVGYHGTIVENAKSILRLGKFWLGKGRMGLGVYFYEGGQEAIDAAQTWAEWKCRRLETGNEWAVVRAMITIRKLVDLESSKNRRFKKLMMPLVHEYVMRNNPNSTWDHPHFLGHVIRECMGHIEDLEGIEAIRSRFAFEESGASEQGFVVFDPENVSGPEIIAGN